MEWELVWRGVVLLFLFGILSELNSIKKLLSNMANNYTEVNMQALLRAKRGDN